MTPLSTSFKLPRASLGNEDALPVFPASQENAWWWTRLMRGLRRLHARPDWNSFVRHDWPDHIMQMVLTDDFHAKQGRSTGKIVLRAGAESLSVYLKRHYELPRWMGLLAAFWPNGEWSPALRECRNLQWALSEGIPVPKVVAAGEFIGSWGHLQSFLAIEELREMVPLHEAIPMAFRTLQSTTFRAWKAGLIREIARLTRLLHDRNRFHKDLYLCHFFIARADITHIPTWVNRVYMIDFHRLTHHPVTRSFWVSKDLGQLLYSSEIEGIDARDRLLFWRAYMGASRKTWRGRWLRRVVAFRGRRYTLHNAKWAARRAA